MRMSTVAWVLLSSAVVSTSGGAQQTALRQEVEALTSAMVSSFRTDPASVARFYTDDAKILGGGQRAEGREQIDAYWRDATMFADWKLEVLEVGGEGDRPWVRGRSTLQGRSGRVMVTEFVGILKRDANRLLFYVDMFVATTPMRRTPGGS